MISREPGNAGCFGERSGGQTVVEGEDFLLYAVLRLFTLNSLNVALIHN